MTKMSKKIHLHHIHIILLSGILILGIFLVAINIQNEQAFQSQKQLIGVSYSPDYAKTLGLDPQQTYLSILQDLKIKAIRLPAYWDNIEPEKDQHDFTDLDWYLQKAQENHVQVILAVGYKLPRWPECRAPKWVDPENLPNLRREQLDMVEQVVRRYNSHPEISSFQIENEPFFDFGICPKADPDFFRGEVKFVKSITQKPVTVTDAGELSSWKDAVQASDIFGTTLYRVVEAPWFGPFQYPLRPWLYRTKSDLVHKLFAPKNQKTIVAELQAEPWATQPLSEIPIKKQSDSFTVKQLNEAVTFARQTGFDESYLWGVEWWYYMSAHNHPEYLNYVKTLSK